VLLGICLTVFFYEL